METEGFVLSLLKQTVMSIFIADLDFGFEIGIVPFYENHKIILFCQMH